MHTFAPWRSRSFVLVPLPGEPTIRMLDIARFPPLGGLPVTMDSSTIGQATATLNTLGMTEEAQTVEKLKNRPADVQLATDVQDCQDLTLRTRRKLVSQSYARALAVGTGANFIVAVGPKGMHVWRR
jgi:hypothetical protein